VSSKEANDGGKIFYAMKKEVENAINQREALPEFQDMVLEILEMNFVQQYTDYEMKHKGELTFATQWPAKLDGKITLENKCSAKDPFANGFSFKISRTDDSVSSEPDEPRVDDDDAMPEPELKDIAKDITEPKRKAEPEQTIGLGREKRK
jgi:hypothetical protein